MTIRRSWSRRRCSGGREDVYLVGHSFGGSVEIKTATRLNGHVTRLLLLETNQFYLLAQQGRHEAFAEAMALRNCIKRYGALGEWTTAAETFADYWNGPGSWRDMTAERRAVFADMLKPNFSEWDAVMDETTPAEQWADLLPRATLQIVDPGTVLPIREIWRFFVDTARCGTMPRRPASVTWPR